MRQMKKLLVLGMGLALLPIHTTYAAASNNNQAVETIQADNTATINKIQQATQNYQNSKIKPIAPPAAPNMQDKIIGKIIMDHDYKLALPFKSGDKLNMANIDQLVENLKTGLTDAIVLLKPTKDPKVYDVIVKTKRLHAIQGNISFDNENSNEEGKDNLYLTLARDHLLSYGDKLTINYKYNLSHDQEKHSNNMWYGNYYIPMGKYKLSFTRYRNNQKITTTDNKYPIKSYVDNTDITLSNVYNRGQKRKLSYYLGSHRVATDFKINNVPLNTSRRHSTNFVLGWSGLYYGNNSAFLINPSFDFVDKAWNNIPSGYPGGYVKSNLNIFYTKNYNVEKNHYDNYALNLVVAYSPVKQLNMMQFSIGGLNSVRGFKDTSFSGDQGFYVRNTWTRHYKNWAPFIGLDFGNIYNLNTKDSATIAGIGLGVDYSRGNFNGKLAVGQSILNKSTAHKEHAPIYLQMNYNF